VSSSGTKEIVSGITSSSELLSIYAKVGATYDLAEPMEKEVMEGSAAYLQFLFSTSELALGATKLEVPFSVGGFLEGLFAGGVNGGLTSWWVASTYGTKPEGGGPE
jgi:hypothetical protein